VDGHQSAKPNGVLLCRVKAAHNVQDTHHSDHEHREPLVDAFVVAHLGHQDFRTKAATGHSGNVAWNMESPFRFQQVDISHLRKQHLHLNLYNHCSFHDSAGHCIGKVKVHIPKLDADIWVSMRESFHGQGELEFELRFLPDGGAGHDIEVIDTPAFVIGDDHAMQEGKNLHASHLSQDPIVVSGDEQSLAQHHSGLGDTAQRHSIASSYQESGSAVSDTGDTSMGVPHPGHSHRDGMENAAFMGATTTGRTDQTDMTVDSDDGSDPVDDEDLAGLLVM